MPWTSLFLMFDYSLFSSVLLWIRSLNTLQCQYFSFGPLLWCGWLSQTGPLRMPFHNGVRWLSIWNALALPHPNSGPANPLSVLVPIIQARIKHKWSLTLWGWFIQSWGKGLIEASFGSTKLSPQSTLHISWQPTFSQDELPLHTAKGFSKHWHNLVVGLG